MSTLCWTHGWSVSLKSVEGISATGWETISNQHSTGFSNRFLSYVSLSQKSFLMCLLNSKGRIQYILYDVFTWCCLWWCLYDFLCFDRMTLCWRQVWWVQFWMACHISVLSQKEASSSLVCSEGWEETSTLRHGRSLPKRWAMKWLCKWFTWKIKMVHVLCH